MKHICLALVFAAFSISASAAVLPVNADWQADQLDVAGQPTLNSPWTVTFTDIGKIWVLDCCITGDVYQLSGDFGGATTFYVGGALDATLFAYSEWFSADSSKLEISGIAPGTYTFSITGDGAGGLPASVLVAATQGVVPEPASWAMMIMGFGLVGFASRRRQVALTA